MLLISLHQQKVLIILFLLVLNVLLIALFVRYEHQWYIFLLLLALATFVNASAALCVLGHKMLWPSAVNNCARAPKNYVYVVPCYNEGLEELRRALDALVTQRITPGDRRLLLIVCDGTVVGQGNTRSTAALLKELLQVAQNEVPHACYPLFYNNFITTLVHVYHRGVFYGGVACVLCVKETNQGKRDSLVLARRLCFNYNEERHCALCKPVFQGEAIDYIIGMDADTVLDRECSHELIEGLEQDPLNYGCVGYVDVITHPGQYSFFKWYQYAEYMFSQCLKRHAQSLITGKVSCLSGCNQILRVTKETCGKDILTLFNRRPAASEHILAQIRGYASEDRNHVGLMLSLYPYARTVQALKAVAYTEVPQSIKVFLSQRRRWNLGATTNDLLLVTLPGINVFERISAAVNVLTYCINPFVVVATAFFIKALSQHPSMLMLYLSLIMLVPLFYVLCIPVFIRPLSFRGALYFYGGMVLYLSCGIAVNLATYLYSLWHMDDVTWGKTRQLASASSTSTSTTYTNTFNNNNHIRSIEEKKNNNNNTRVIDVDAYMIIIDFEKALSFNKTESEV